MHRQGKPCPLLYCCCKLNHTSQHSVPFTTSNVMPHGVEICSQSKESIHGVYSNKELREMMLQPRHAHAPEAGMPMHVYITLKHTHTHLPFLTTKAATAFTHSRFYFYISKKQVAFCFSFPTVITKYLQ